MLLILFISIVVASITAHLFSSLSRNSFSLAYTDVPKLYSVSFSASSATAIISVPKSEISEKLSLSYFTLVAPFVITHARGISIPSGTFLDEESILLFFPIKRQLSACSESSTASTLAAFFNRLSGISLLSNRSGSSFFSAAVFSLSAYSASGIAVSSTVTLPNLSVKSSVMLFIAAASYEPSATEYHTLITALSRVCSERFDR